jgi:AcrR family transcriptional regulator
MSKPTYHHGALAEALVDAALTHVERAGVETLSMRELAQSLGVSHGAPYRHFADRDALLAAVAARGFVDLIAVYEAALAGPGHSLSRLEALNLGFFDFAMRRRNLYRLMFESDFLNRSPPPPVLAGPAEAAYRLIWRAVAAAVPDANEADVKVRTVIMTCTSHGFLSLDAGGRFKPFMYEPLSRDDLVRAVMDAVMREGLASST